MNIKKQKYIYLVILFFLTSCSSFLGDRTNKIQVPSPLNSSPTPNSTVTITPALFPSPTVVPEKIQLPKSTLISAPIPSQLETLSSYNLSQAQLIREVILGDGFVGKPYSVDWSTDGEMIAVGSSIGIWILQSSTLDTISTYDIPNIIEVKFVNSKRQLIAMAQEDQSNYYSFMLIDLDQERRLINLDGSGSASRFCTNDDGSLFAITTLDGLKVFALNDSQILFSANGKFLDCNFLPQSKEIIVWEFETNKFRLFNFQQKILQESIDAKSDGYNRFGVMPDGTKILLGDENNISIIDIDQNKTYPLEINGNYAVDALAWSHTGKYFAIATFDGILTIWDSTSQKTIKVLPNSGTRSFAGVAFSPDDTRIVGLTSNGALHLWSIPDGKLIEKTNGNMAFDIISAISQNGKWLATSDADGLLTVWNIYENKIVWVFNNELGLISSLSFSVDEQYLVSATNLSKSCLSSYCSERATANGEPTHEIIVYNLNSGQISYRDVNAQAGAYFSLDGKYLMACGVGKQPPFLSYTIGNWDQDIFSKDGSQACRIDFALNPENNRIATINRLESYEQNPSRTVYWAGRHVEGDEGNVAFSSDGNFVAFTSSENWEDVKVCKGDAPLSLNNQIEQNCIGSNLVFVASGLGTVTFLEFSSDGTILIIRTAKGITFYNTSTGNKIDSPVESGRHAWILSPSNMVISINNGKLLFWGIPSQ